MHSYVVILIKWALLIGSGIALGITQYRFARNNYPDSREWKYRLIIAGYLVGVAGMWVAVDTQDPLRTLLLAAFIGGPLMSYVSLKWLPKQSKTYMPVQSDEMPEK